MKDFAKRRRIIYENKTFVSDEWIKSMAQNQSKNNPTLLIPSTCLSSINKTPRPFISPHLPPYLISSVLSVMRE